MINKIDLELDDIKSVCKKHSLDIDHFWLGVNKRYCLNKSKNSGCRTKRSGIPLDVLFQIALCLPFFMGNSIKSFFMSSFQKMLTCGSTPFYRFYQDSIFNWRNAVYSMNNQIELKCSDSEIIKNTNPTALIVDDSVLPKRGKRIEGVSRVFDHVTRKHIIGYKFLGICWFNGFYSRFLDFSLVAEKKLSFKRGKSQFNKKRNKNSAASLRKAELKKDKISLACEMFTRAVKKGFIPDFFLCDTWFTCADIMNKVRLKSKGKTHFLGMIKDGRRKFIYEGQKFTLGKLRKHLMTKKKRCSKYKSRYISVKCLLPEVGEVTVFFSRFSGNRKWVALITTKQDMSYIKMIQVYSIRWNIEIGFKEMKQLLGLGKSHANDFAAQIAHASCVIIAHAILADCKYHEEYQSMGILFESVKEQYNSLLTMDKILLLIEYILVTISQHLGGIKNITVDELMNSSMYIDFKNMIANSMTFNVEFAKSSLLSYSQDDISLAG